VTGLASSTNPWKVRARLASSTNINAEIIFQAEAVLQNDGFIQFTTLGISDIADSFIIDYDLIPPSGATL
jgi:hypothetical protein